ncbi:MULTISPECIES: DUF1788 domain-containing protein [Erysipelotrichaceae]|uniref:DUF1788 domain-containing protein n=1 Tax=Erysipelotrichaceae TaxID=128827 RepID=UPI0023F440DC|nr:MULTISPECIES: DUF1788 domain-containing protein [Erysipelotrichaceae]
MVTDKLEKLKERINNPDFLNNKGLSNEVGIHVFCYDPKEEMIIKDFVRRLKNDHNLNCHIVEFDLYKSFLKALENEGILDEVAEVEREVSKEELLDSLDTDLEALMEAAEIGDLELGKDLLLLTGIGDVFPFVRAHYVLNALQQEVEVPVIAFYPGTYNGRDLKLFNKIDDKNYYRAFSLF